MIRSFDKELFLKVIIDRPANARNLVDPSPEFLAKCFIQNFKTAQYVREKLTLPVLKEYVKLLGKKSKTHTNWYAPDSLCLFDQEVLNKLPESEIRTLFKAQPGTISYFPNAPHELWYEYLNNGNQHFQFKDIPEQHRTEQMLITRLALRASHRDEVPSVLTDKIVDAALAIKPEDVFNNLPSEFQTPDRLRRVINTQPGFSLDCNLEAACLDQELANLLSASDANNIRRLPERYITKEIALAGVKEMATNIECVPKKIMDEDVIYAAMTSGDLSYHRDDVPYKFFKGRKTLLKLAELDLTAKYPAKMIGVTNYLRLAGDKIDETVWIEMIRINPRVLQVIAKEFQTTAILDAFFETAEITLIDELYHKINLARIKKEHSPFLIGTKVKLLQDIIQRKNVKQTRTPRKAEEIKAVEPTITPDTQAIAVDLTDAEYLDILKKY